MAPRRPPIVAQERRTRRRCSSRRRSESSATTCVPPDPPFSISVTRPADSRFCRVVCRRPVAASQNATRWRPAGATDQPLFLYYAPHLVHQPYEVPQRYLDAFAFIDVLVEDVITLIDQFRLLRIVRMLLPLLFAVPKQERACLTGKQVLLRLLRGMYVRWNWGSVAISSLVTSGFLLLHDSCRIILIRNLESFIEDEFPNLEF